MTTRTTLNTAEIKALLGISERTARRIKAKVIEHSTAKGRLPISSRKCLIQDFAELYGVSVDMINLALERKRL